MSLAESRCWAVVPAAGSGSRMAADVPKQYLEIDGAPLLHHSVSALLHCRQIEAVCVALPDDDSRAAALPVMADPRVVTTTGAAQRSGSVLAGLQTLAERADEDDWVLVHDAARPCLRLHDLEALLSAVSASGVGGLLAEPVVDTIKEVDADCRVIATADRSRLWRAQTPQMFRLGELQAALREVLAAGVGITDEAFRDGVRRFARADCALWRTQY